VVRTLIEAAVTGANDVLAGLFKSVPFVGRLTAKLDRYLSWGATKGCAVVTAKLHEFIAADPDGKPDGLECQPQTFAQRPVEMLVPMVTAALEGAIEIALDLLNEHVISPAINQLTTIVHQSITGTLPQAIVGLCGLIPEAGGPICGAVSTTITTIAGSIIPGLVDNFLQGLNSYLDKFLSQTIPTLAQQIVTSLGNVKVLGTSAAALVQNLELNFDAAFKCLTPLVEIVEPLLNDLLGLAMPNFNNELASCGEQFNGLYKFMQSRWCPKPGVVHSESSSPEHAPNSTTTAGHN
jgi:hypothetical protein